MDCLKGLAMVGLHGDLLFTDRIKEGWTQGWSPIIVLNLLMLLRAFIMVRDDQEEDDLSNASLRPD
jgi:hypothetical protein